MQCLCRIGCFVLPLLLTGCITRTDYPKDWAGTVKGGCERVTGIYANKGARESNEWPLGERRFPTVLTQYLFDPVERPNLLNGIEKADRVEIVYAAGTLTANIMVGADVLAKAEFSEKAGNLKCTPQGAAIDVHSGSMTPQKDPIAMGYSHIYETLMPTADGALAVREVNSGVGLVFFVWPIAGSNAYWARFEAWHPAATP